MLLVMMVIRGLLLLRLLRQKCRGIRRVVLLLLLVLSGQRRSRATVGAGAATIVGMMVPIQGLRLGVGILREGNKRGTKRMCCAL